MAAVSGPSGYSGTPLRKKLGITDSSSVLIVGPAPAMHEVVATTTESTSRLDVLLVFVTRRSEFADGLPAWSESIQPDGAIWICWPKRSARQMLASDMTEDIVREVALPTGLVDNKVCAVDEVWSALRLVWRVELRPAKRARRQ